MKRILKLVSLLSLLLAFAQSEAQNEFITTWQTTSASESITIPINPIGLTYDYTVDWGDGMVETNITASATHTYALAGTYTVKISGTFPAIFFDGLGDKDKILSIEQWGNIQWATMEQAFEGCTNLTYNAIDAPDLSLATSMRDIFSGCTQLDGDLSSWNVSTITDMQAAFSSAINFNGNVTTWNVANVESMSGMFSNATSFNQDISGWNVEKVTNFGIMFVQATSFNQPVGNWTTSALINVQATFFGATAFNQNLGNWNMTNAGSVFNMLDNSGLSTSNYDATLQGWAGQTLSAGKNIGVAGLTYCKGATARASIPWNFIGDSEDCHPTWNGTSWEQGMPSGSEDATINGDYQTSLHGAFEAINLTVNSGFTLTLNGDSSVSISGNLMNDGTMIVQDSTAFIQTATSPINSGTGTYTIEREGAGYHGHYNYWSSPVMNSTITDAFGTNGRNFYTFNATSQAWQGASTTTVLSAGQGFIATGTSATPATITRTFSDNLGFNSGTISYPIIFNSDADTENDWNLIGNPYPSSLDVNTFLTDNSAIIESAVYLWSSDGNDYNSSDADYAVMGLAGSVSAGGSGIAPTSATVSSAQGFFVQSKASGNVVFSNSQRIGANNTFQRVNSDWGRIWLGVKNQNGAKNEVLLAFLDEAKEGKDLYDANKLSGNSQLSFYSLADFKEKEGERLAIQGLPSLMETNAVFVGLDAKQAGQFTFSINHLDGIDEQAGIYLYDGVSGELVDLRERNYTISLEKGVYNDRFELRFVEGKVTSLPEELNDLGVKVFSSSKQVRLQFTNLEVAQSAVALYDISSRQIGIYQNRDKLDLTIPVQQSGIYIVKVKTAKGVISKKVFVD